MDDAFVSKLLKLMIVIFIMSIVHTFFGMLGGWIVGWFYQDMFNFVLNAFGVSAIPVYKLGAFLGFVSAFLRDVSR